MRTPALLLTLACLLAAPAVASAQPAGENPHHPWHGLEAGWNGDLEARAFIEISKGSKNKNEVDKATGKIKLDRVIKYHSGYPANYGFIPRTYAPDKDPLDVLVLGKTPLTPGSVVDVRIIGVMRMIDQGEGDDKLIAVSRSDAELGKLRDLSEVPPEKLAEIKTFFSEYKILERKVVEVKTPEGPEAARKIVKDAFADYDLLRRGIDKYKPAEPKPEPRVEAPKPSGFFASVRGAFERAYAAVFGPKVETSRGMTELLRERMKSGADRDKTRLR